jgi:hypothetical protein
MAPSLVVLLMVVFLAATAVGVVRQPPTRAEKAAAAAAQKRAEMRRRNAPVLLSSARLCSLLGGDRRTRRLPGHAERAQVCRVQYALGGTLGGDRIELKLPAGSRRIVGRLSTANSGDSLSFVKSCRGGVGADPSASKVIQDVPLQRSQMIRISIPVRRLQKVCLWWKSKFTWLDWDLRLVGVRVIGKKPK